MEIKDKFPAVKKRVKMFLQSEEGKITREQAVAAAATLLLTAPVLASRAYRSDPAAGGSSVKAMLNQRFAEKRYGMHGSHSSHGSHCSHGSHASHGSHGSHASHGSHGSHSSHGSHASHGSHGSHGSW